MKHALILVLIALLTACGGSDEPIPTDSDGRATIGTPNCAASGVCS